MMPNETTRSAPAAGASPEKKALLEAFDTVLKQQAEEREAQRLEAEARRRARGRVRPVISVAAALTLFLAAYLWIERPDWIFPPPVAAESVALREASLRIGMANAAQHLEWYRQHHGALPQSLQEAGAHGEGLIYERSGSSDWRLTGSSGGVRLTLTSRDPLPGFIGNSFELISRRSR